MANTRTQFTIPKGDGEPPNFFLKNWAPSSKPQDTSNRQQATGNRRAGGPTGSKLLTLWDFLV